MPALSSTMTEGKIVSWLKSPGDKISKGESVVVVGTYAYCLSCRDAVVAATHSGPCMPPLSAKT